MGLLHWMIDFDGINVGRYTIHMDAMDDISAPISSRPVLTGYKRPLPVLVIEKGKCLQPTQPTNQTNLTNQPNHPTHPTNRTNPTQPNRIRKKKTRLAGFSPSARGFARMDLLLPVSCVVRTEPSTSPRGFPVSRCSETSGKNDISML